MGKATVIPNILFPDYHRFVGLFATDRDFPALYHVWATAYATRVSEAKARDETVVEQAVRPTEFVEWCYSNNLAMRSSSLQAFAEFKAT